MKRWGFITALIAILLLTQAAAPGVTPEASVKYATSGAKPPAITVPPASTPVGQLPRVKSYAHLKQLMSEASKSGMYNTGIMINAREFTVAEKTMEPMAFSSTQDTSASDSGASAGADHSTTNTQVQGVDEADVIKTDGKYIYQVNQKRLIITSALPADNMKLVAQISYEDDTFYPLELYVDGDRLVVIGTESTFSGDQPITIMGQSAKPMIYPLVPMTVTTKAIVYDIRSIAKPKLVRELELEGSYISSRMIGDSLYMITNKYADIYTIMNSKDRVPAPLYRDSAHNSKLIEFDYRNIRYFPDFIEPNYMLVGAVDLAGKDAMDVQTYLGSGQNIYASAEHLYVAVTHYEADNPQPTTKIYQFSLQKSAITYLAEGSVPGTIINQFAMDEFKGHLRVATTTNETWGEDAIPSQNNLYVLGESLKQVGKIEGIAPGERIYSVRFTGERAYMVTFRTVDPLFVIDVANPAKPAILGALKIPGYSDYLHPYDDNHLIGFGKDTVEMTIKDTSGRTIGTNAYYLGMKVALFDVTDVENPIELHKVIIGDRGTNSELLYNHKALLFSREKNLLAFPVELYEVKDTKQSLKLGQMPEYGVFSYQGAYIYSLTPKDGFQLRGRITHMSRNDLLKSGNIAWNGNQFVRRALYIGDNLYTVSDSMIKANSLKDLRELGRVNIPSR